MDASKKSLMIPLLLVAVGTGWLLTTLGVVPGVDWCWTLGLAVVGVLAFIAGFDKLTFVVGTFFIIASCLSLLRQTGRLELDVEVPILVIAAGLLMLMARHSGIPAPTWVLESQQKA